MSAARRKATFDIANPKLAAEGRRRTEWAAGEMPVMRYLTDKYTKSRPLSGQRIAACLHVTSETANLMIALKAAGADLRLCASNPLSTQDDVAAHLVQDHNISTFAIHATDRDTYYGHINATLDMTKDEQSKAQQMKAALEQSQAQMKEGAAKAAEDSKKKGADKSE